MWNSKPADNVSPDEVCAFGLGDRGQRLGFYPLGEVIYRYDNKLSLCPSGLERSDQVYSPFCEWPGVDDWRQWFERLF